MSDTGTGPITVITWADASRGFGLTVEAVGAIIADATDAAEVALNTDDGLTSAGLRVLSNHVRDLARGKRDDDPAPRRNRRWHAPQLKMHHVIIATLGGFVACFAFMAWAVNQTPIDERPAESAPAESINPGALPELTAPAGVDLEPSNLAPCASEDEDGASLAAPCLFDSRIRGNGDGTPFVVMPGNGAPGAVITLTGQGA